MSSNRSRGYHLPEDVVTEILLRLKVKSLLRFKCICKHWYAFIENQNFISNHFKHKSNTDRLLVHHCEVDNKKYVTTLFMDQTLLRYEQPHHLQFPDLIETLVGNLNGIFCVVNKKRQCALWNPATREFKPLPLSRPDIAPHYNCYLYALGLGFEPSTNDHKVVWMRHFAYFDVETNEDDFYYPQVISVYSLNSNSWRHFEDDDVLDHFCIYDLHYNTYLNGFLYWWAQGNGYLAIVAFDVCREVFTEIQVPEAMQSQENRLSIHNNSIALISFDPQVFDKFIDIWIMKETGRWTKHITIGPIFDIKWYYDISLWNNKLLCRTTTNSLQIIYYLHDLHTREIFKLEAPVQGDKSRLSFFLDYKESLISLKRKNEDQEECNHNQSDIIKNFFKRPTY